MSQQLPDHSEADTHDEASLPAAIDALYAAVAALVDVRKELIGGAVRAAPSLYESLLGEIPAKAGDTGQRFNGRSRPPLWVDALDLRNEIDTATASWLPEATTTTTPVRLRALASKRWRPQDVRDVGTHANDVRAWCLSIRNLLDPQRVKTVAAPCPACGTRWVYRSHAGEQVRQPALQLVADQGCSCLSCRTTWTPDRYLFLVKLLGFELPAGIVAD